MISLDQAINLKVRITNLLDESISGTIYAFSIKQKVLALRISSQSSGKLQTLPPEEVYKIMNTAFVKSITVLPPFPKKNVRPAESLANIPKIDVNQIESALNQMILNANQSLPSRITPQTSSRISSTPITGKSLGASVRKPDSGSLASKVFDRLTAKLGKENVQWQGNELILLFKEVAVSKPYALNKISNSKRTQSSKHLERARAALREAWLADDNSRRGG